MKKLLIGALILVFAVVIGTTTRAESPTRYNTYTTSNQQIVRTQTAYTPVTSVNQVFGESLDEPNDIHIDEDNTIYIVSNSDDTGKLMVFNLESEEMTVIGEDFLVNPTGVHVNDNGNILIADRGGRVAYRLDEDGNVLQTYTKPNSPLFGDIAFQPKKIVGDNHGNVYILNQGTRGLAQFGPSGQFLGYYGTNTITPTFRTIIQYTFFTEEQQSRIFNLTPPEVTNMDIDERGLIHTVSKGVSGRGVKRLNISGDNLLPEVYNARDLTDVAVGPIGNIYTITDSGMIYEYDRDGNMLFMFGGQDVSGQIKGLFNVPSAIAVDSDSNIYAIDEASGEMKIYMPTQFTNLVHTALETYQEGFYLESQEPWAEVLKMNDFFDLAHQGMGNAHYSLGEYEEALESYEIAYERGGYSDALWEVRNDWLLENVGIIIGVIFAWLFLYVINLKAKFMHYATDPIKHTYKKAKEKSKTFDQVMYVFSYLKNPADASYEIKRRSRVGYLPATILLIIYFFFYIYYIYELNFLFNYRVISSINVGEEMIKIFLPFILWVLANYLIGSIREGEGRFKDVYITTIFSIFPFFISLPIITVMSQALTYNEAFLIEFIQILAILLTVIYFFFMVKETHYYTIKETFQSIFISAFTMVMLMLGTFIIYMLLNELFVVIKDITMEVLQRV
ncbi:MAG: YIP1 family protein [Bacillota bacterium]